MAKQYAGIDGGYSAFKGISKNGQVYIPSVTAPPIGEVFGLAGNKEVDAIRIEGIGEYSFGEQAIIQSTMLSRREDRHWYESDDYLVLLLTTITEMFEDKTIDLVLTTGLPVSFYQADREKLATRIEGSYTVQRVGREEQHIIIKRENLSIIPQPSGTLFSQALNAEGDLHADGSDLMMNQVAIIDIGGHTTNFQVTEKMVQLVAKNDSIDVGGWRIVQAAKAYINTLCPEMPEMKDHTVAVAVREKKVFYGGEYVDLSVGVDEILTSMAKAITAKATSLWQTAKDIHVVLVTGGGALLLGDLLADMYPHHAMTVVDDPVFCNAMGYYYKSLRKLKNA